MRTRIVLRGALCAEFHNFVSASVNPTSAAAEFLRRIAASRDPSFAREWHDNTLVVRRKGDFSADQWPMPEGGHG